MAEIDNAEQLAGRELRVALQVFGVRNAPLDAWEATHLTRAVEAIQGKQFTLARNHAVDSQIAVSERGKLQTIEGVNNSFQHFQVIFEELLPPPK